MRTTIEQEFKEIALVHSLAVGVVIAFLALATVAELVASIAATA